MAPNSNKWKREHERLDQCLRRLDKELRRLKAVEDFHQTKGREVRDQLTRLGARLSSASGETALKRAALATAQRELDTANSLEAQAKRDVDRLATQQVEHDALVHTSQMEGRDVKGQRDQSCQEGQGALYPGGRGDPAATRV